MSAAPSVANGHLACSVCKHHLSVDSFSVPQRLNDKRTCKVCFSRPSSAAALGTPAAPGQARPASASAVTPNKHAPEMTAAGAAAPPAAAPAGAEAAKQTKSGKPKHNSSSSSSSSNSAASSSPLPTPAVSDTAAVTAELRKLPFMMRSLQSGLYERDGELRLATLCALAGEHIILLGPPGTGKSMISRRLCDAFQVPAVEQFKYLMTAFTRPDELLGPYSLKRLAKDEQFRIVKGYLPWARIAFLDEVFKASSEILNSLLAILEDRLFNNGSDEVAVPLVFLLAASNEQPANSEPALQALYDRFLIRRWVDYVQDDESFKAVVGLPSTAANARPMAHTHPITLTKELQDQLKRVVRGTNIEFPAELQQALVDLAKLLKRKLRKDGTMAPPTPTPEAAAAAPSVTSSSSSKAAAGASKKKNDGSCEFLVSDRRWRKIVYLVQLSGFVHSLLLPRRAPARISVADLYLIVHCTWRQPYPEMDTIQHALKRVLQTTLDAWAPVKQTATTAKAGGAAAAPSSSASSSSASSSSGSVSPAARLKWEQDSVRQHLFLSRADKKALAVWLHFTLSDAEMDEAEAALCSDSSEHADAAKAPGGTPRECERCKGKKQINPAGGSGAEPGCKECGMQFKS